MVAKEAARFPLGDQVCKTFPMTMKHERVFEVPQATQVLFLEDKVCLPGATCTRAEYRAIEFF